MAQGVGESVAVSCRSSGWIRAPSGGNDQDWGSVLAANTRNTKSLFFCPADLHPADFRHLPPAMDFDVTPAAVFQQYIQDIPGLPGEGKYLAFWFNEHSQASCLKVGYEVLVGEAEDGRPEESALTLISIVVKERADVSRMSDIALAGAGYKELSSWGGILLQNKDTSLVASARAGIYGAKQTRRARTYDDQVKAIDGATGRRLFLLYFVLTFVQMFAFVLHGYSPHPYLWQ